MKVITMREITKAGHTSERGEKFTRKLVFSSHSCDFSAESTVRLFSAHNCFSFAGRWTSDYDLLDLRVKFAVQRQLKVVN